MKVITVWQPWASLIAIGAKPYEFRSWKPPASLIGRRIAIHAAARLVMASEVRALILALKGAKGFRCPCLDANIALPILQAILDGLSGSPDTLFATPAARSVPLSHVVCTAVLGEPRRGDEIAREFGETGNPPGEANWGWPMLDVERLLPPVPARGRQGLWDLSLPEGMIP